MKNFVVVTYWWGRGKICNNSAYNFFKSDKPSEQLKKFEDLADEWVKQMILFEIDYYIELR